MYSYKLSVLLSTYNHEKYIAEAIESIIDQKTEFDFKIVVSDDVSNDRTPLIIESYRDKYPNKIRVLKHEKNIGVTKNLQRGLNECKGQYIAILEGDDFWISPKKLQRQVDFLADNTQCSMCFNGLLVLNNEKQVLKSGVDFDKIVYNTTDVIKHCWVGCNFSTCLYRNDIVKKLPSKLYEIFSVDWMFNIAFLEDGLLGCIPLQMTAYRVHSQSVWSSKSSEESAKEFIGLIPLYDEVLNFRHTKNFSEAADVLKNTLKRKMFLSSSISKTKTYSFLKKITPLIIIDVIKNTRYFSVIGQFLGSCITQSLIHRSITRIFLCS